jgi:flavin reductase (DIM6/NTAB) family NADH-FMN oxidoreductase RutF
MHYDPRSEVSGLPHSPFTSCAVPRPIGWISTIGEDGVGNLAPFSQFQNVTWDPPTVLFSSNGDPQTDTYRNAAATGEFVWNMATYAQRDVVARSGGAYPPGVDEFEELGIATLPSLRVRPARVADSPVHFECVVRQIVDVPGNIPAANAKVVFGEVVMIHIRDDALTGDGRIDVPRLRPLARLGYLDYGSITERFELEGHGRSTLHHHDEHAPAT